jgi:RimJ/RimL family protein N-acetyltransferase
MALLKAVGMHQEAHFRESLLFRGEWVDDVVFALLAREWRNMAGKGAGFAASR